jgi:hypothetical protein
LYNCSLFYYLRPLLLLYGSKPFPPHRGQRPPAPPSPPHWRQLIHREPIDNFFLSNCNANTLRSSAENANLSALLRTCSSCWQSSRSLLARLMRRRRSERRNSLRLAAYFTQMHSYKLVGCALPSATRTKCSCAGVIASSLPSARAWSQEPCRESNALSSAVNPSHAPRS